MPVTSKLRCKRGSRKGTLQRRSAEGNWYYTSRSDARKLPEYNSTLSRTACKQNYAPKRRKRARPYRGAKRWYENVDVDVDVDAWPYPYRFVPRWYRRTIPYIGLHKIYAPSPQVWLDHDNLLLLRATPKPKPEPKTDKKK